ncbi:CDP-alcohol phosphatidyltransferase family protein [Clostridium sporogenes]|uniref:CDP-alcohol phosphatidyltransferase family protein n=1 Tax=Clostridium sporogenes TaxID=1509 RepID=UPI003DA5C751
MIKKKTKRKDGTMYIIEKVYREDIINKILPYISKTSVTPNNVTVFNMLLGILAIYLAYKGNLLYTAVLFQIYELLDHLDGSLARYKHMMSSIGEKLDILSDTIFYNAIFIFIGWDRVSIYLISLLIITMNFYGIVTKYYIVPRLKKISNFKRFGIKKYFFNRGYILGMDLTLLGAITTIGLFLGKIKLIYIIVIFLYIVDIIYRMCELRYNEKIKIKL